MGIDYFYKRCAAIPPSGGSGCHQAQLSAANAGVKAGLTDDEIFDGIRDAIIDTARYVPDSEIWNTINTARKDAGCVPEHSRRGFKTSPLVVGNKLRAALVAQSPNVDFTALAATSPLQIPSDPEKQFAAFTSVLYAPDDLLYAGGEIVTPDDQPKNIYSVRQLTTMPPPHFRFIINPVSGQPAENHSGNLSYRCDNNVTAFRYVLLEMDGVTLQEQTAIWSTITRQQLLPVAAVYYSGGKSLHGLIRLSGCGTVQHWQSVIHNDFFPRVAEPLGVDGACKNPARFSRTPGAIESGRACQWLLWLSGSQI